VVIAEKPLGQGRVVLFGTMADRDWNNLVVETGFYPMLLHETVSFLLRQPFERPLTVSAPLVLPLPAADANEASVVFRDPSGRSRSMSAVVHGGQRWAELEQTEQPGFYEVRYSSEVPPLVAAVNVDPREGDVHTIPVEQLNATFEGLKVRVVEEADSISTAVQEGRVGRELWKELLLLGIAALLVETFLAHWFTRKAAAARQTASRAVTRSLETAVR
jgi:hypothetical protein